MGKRTFASLPWPFQAQADSKSQSLAIRVMTAPKVIDYKTTELKKNGRKVDEARMLGKAVEDYQNLASTIGVNSITPGRLPASVELSLDQPRGRRNVLYHAEEREVAVEIGFGLRQKLREAGYDVLGANVPVFEQRAKLGEHDLILSIAKPVGTAIAGRLSVEVKCRRVRDGQHRENLLKILKKEAWKGSEDHAWWEDLVAQRPDWAGRMLVLIELPYSGGSLRPWSFHSQVRLLGPNTDWRQGWSWRVPPPLPPVPPKAPARPAPKAAPKAVPKAAAPKAAAKAVAKPSWESVRAKLVWKDHRNKRVASVKKFLGILKQPLTNPGRSVVAWRRKYTNSAGPGPHFFQIDRSLVEPDCKPGGVETHAVSEEILRLAHGGM